MAKKNTIGFGIVGTGMIARFHAKAIADVKGAKLIGCWDSVVERTAQFGKDNHCTGFPTLKAMLDSNEIDIITICTPSGAHMEPAVAAANAGKHVIVEKPLEITLARCDAIIKACDKNKVHLGSIFPSRFHQSSQDMRKAVDANRFGRITLAEAYVKWWRTQAYYDSGAWRGTWELDGGGALMNQAIHSVDLLQWLVGPVAEIRAQVATLAHERIPVEDTAVATLRFVNGALGVIEATTAANPGYLKEVEIHGSEGSAKMKEEDIIAWDFTKKDRMDTAIKKRMESASSTGGGASDPSAIGHHGHARQFTDFVNAIRAGKPPALDGREGRKAVEIILAIYLAAETGQSVTLPLKKDPDLKARKKKKGK
jgi:predicted dehydrogenase